MKLAFFLQELQEKKFLFVQTYLIFFFFFIIFYFIIFFRRVERKK